MRADPRAYQQKRILSDEVGKMPPSAVEVEEAVLGSIILEPENLREIMFLKPEFFYREQNEVIFKAILAINKGGEFKIDYLSVGQQLKKTEELEIAGGFYYITQLTSKVASTVNTEFNARIIHQKFLLRELIRLGTNIIKQAYEASADAFEIIEGITKETDQLTAVITNKIKDVGQIFNEVIDEIKEVQENGLPTGLYSGLKNVDNHTGGWQKGTLNILAARPGMGKTALCLALAKYPALELKKGVAIFSLEMRAKQLVGRLAASESEITSSKINQKKIDRLELQTMAARSHKLIDAPIYIDDTPGISIYDFWAKAKKLHHDHKIELIIIDYLQLMTVPDIKFREQEIAFISRSLKNYSKELDLPIIALSQLSRQSENRPGQSKRPQLSDLRESGAIEQDADNVMFIYRPEYYGLDEMYEYRSKTGIIHLSPQNLMILDFAKGRELALGEVPLKFYGQFMKCDNYDLGYDKPEIHAPEPKALEQNNNFLKEPF